MKSRIIPSGYISCEPFDANSFKNLIEKPGVKIIGYGGFTPAELEAVGLPPSGADDFKKQAQKK